MRSILLLLSVMMVLDDPVSSTIVLADFQQQALIQHNYQRQLHCTGAVTLNSTLNDIAQNYSEYLAANSLFQHSGASGLGENLYALFGGAAITFVNGSTPTVSWYNEISLYNYSSPGFSSSTGHFTQVIWVGSTQLGIGIALTSNSQSAYVVANYYPAGNVLGSFPANVLPLCTNTTTTVGSASTSATSITTGGPNATSTAGSATTSATTITTGGTSTTKATSNSAMIDSRMNIRLTTMLVVLRALFNLLLQN